MYTKILFRGIITNDNNDECTISSSNVGNWFRIIRLFKWVNWIIICTCANIIHDILSIYLSTFKKYAQKRNYINRIDSCYFFSVNDWWNWFPFLILKLTITYFLRFMYYGLISWNGFHSCFAWDDRILWNK